MKTLLPWIALGTVAFATCLPAMAQSPELVLRDLESKSPKKLNKDEVTQLMTGAKILRVSPTGNVVQWANESGGSFIASSENRDRAAAKATTANGKWHISDDGRYCVLIEWKRNPTEEWCRLVFETSDGYYTARSDSVATERVHKLEIKK